MGLFGTNKRTIVVSVDAVLKSKGVRGSVAPRQQLQVLRSLSRLVQRENMNVTAVIAGEELNKAPHNKVFDHVRVRYAKAAGGVSGELTKSLRQAGSSAVLVTDDVELEAKAIRGGIDTLRLSTFRKLIDDGNDGGGQGGGARDRNSGGRNNRRNRDNNRENDRESRPERKKQQRQPKQPRQTPEQDEISQMIDLVD